MLLTIKKGGVLTFYNNYDKLNPKDITEVSPYHLQNMCELDSDVTLKDVFLIIQKNIDIYKIIINNNVELFLEEGFNDPKEYINKYDPEGVEYLQLSKSINWNDASSITHCTLFGIGYELKEDYDIHKSGNRISWAIDLEPVNTYINYPLKLKTDVELVEFPYSDLTKLNNEYEEHAFTLFDILYWIIYELSFYGPPKKRDEEYKKLLEIKDIAA